MDSSDSFRELQRASLLTLSLENAIPFQCQKMTWGYGHCGFTCESQCPPHQVCIQPPPFCVTVPGPILSCSNDTLAVDCNAPCGYGCGGWGGYGGLGGYGGWGNWGGSRGWGGCGYGRGFGSWGGYNGYCGGWGRPFYGGCGW